MKMENLIVITFAAVILFGIIYQIISLFILKNELNNQKNKPKKNFNIFPSISILKPINGIDDQLEENLKSFFQLNYPNYEIIFGLHSYNDPAYKIVNKLTKSFPNIKTKIIVDDFNIGLNPKINNLYNMYPNAIGDYLFISDSNTRVEPDFLKLLLTEFDDKEMGLVTATIRGIGAKNIPSIMENIHLNSFLSPSVFSASHLAKISIVIGKAILIPKNILERIGSFEAFKFYLAEDYLMGIKVEELGYKVKTSPVFVNNVNENLNMKKFLNRHSRWAKMRAKIRLGTYLLESFSNPISASFILALILHNFIGVEQFVLAIVLKSSIDFLTLRLIKSDIKWYQIIVIPIKDLIIGLLWYIPFIDSKVTWRNNSFKIQKKSLLQPI
jgi:ceramide glucosyltransferase